MCILAGAQTLSHINKDSAAEAADTPHKLQSAASEAIIIWKVHRLCHTILASKRTLQILRLLSLGY